jgi:ATP-dependent RNA helicase RhlE
MNFSDLQLHPDLERAVADLGFTTPTPIQAQAIPPGLAGRDVLACAMTGSGKTAAFALPILQRLLAADAGAGAAAKRRHATRALVLAPTRELAAQIVEHFEALARHTPYRAAAVFGGVGMEPQERALRQGVDVVVACPGRLLDHFQHAYARLAELEVLVLDEADRMLDMGFLPDIRRVLRHIPQPAQTLMFSATVPPPIRELASQMLRQPVSIDVGRPSAPATGVRQTVFPVRQEIKSALLLELLRGNAGHQVGSALVFTRTKHRANRLAQYLERHGVPCERIHGNRSQGQRTQALEGFKSGRYRVLVATDVAARGIDIFELTHVVNFDVPLVPEDYVHRVGRTARAGATGEAITFFAPEEEGELRAIERLVGKPIRRETVDGFDYSARPNEKLEIPIAERIAEIRARKAEERKRAAEKAQRKAAAQQPRAGGAPSPRPPAGGAPARGSHRPGGVASPPSRRRGPTGPSPAARPAAHVPAAFRSHRPDAEQPSGPASIHELVRRTAADTTPGSASRPQRSRGRGWGRR